MVATLGAIWIGAVCAAPSVARDAAYGTTLFHFYQGDYFTAAVNGSAALQRDRLPNHLAETRLLLGGIQLSYGMRRSATRIFEQLLTEEVAPEVRNRAWYFLARLAYNQGDYGTAQATLNRMDRQAEPDPGLDAELLAVLVALGDGRPQAVIEQLLRPGDGQPANPYLRYNLAVALQQHGESGAALNLFDQLGSTLPDDEEGATIADLANLAAGFHLLRGEQPAAARQFFSRIRLDSTATDDALLGTGWAALADGDPRGALAPWTALADRTPSTVAAMEAHLALPYAHGLLGGNAQAVSLYRRADERLSDERTYLTQLREQLAAMDPMVLRRQVRDDLRPMSDSARAHLPDLVKSVPFQTALDDYAALTRQLANLRRSLDNLAAFELMVNTRRERFSRVVPVIEQKLAGIQLPGLERREQALIDRLTAMREGNEVWLAADAQEREQRNEIARVTQRLQAHPPGPERDALLRKAHLLSGLLEWEVNARFPERQWALTASLNQASDLLEQVRDRLTRLRDARRIADGRVADFNTRIAHQRDRIQQLLPRVERTLTAQGSALRQMIGEHLAQRDALLLAYLSQVRYAQAQLLDQLSIRREETQP